MHIVSRIIDNTFIDKIKYGNYSIHPLINRLSDHDSQLIKINNIINESNSEIHNINTTSSSDLHTPMENLMTLQKTLLSWN
jgi:hypothetical protein